jgi:hypothetical protein
MARYEIRDIMVQTYLLLIFTTGVMLSGCGGVQPTVGGTAGTLSIGDELLSDIQLTVHHVEGQETKPIGFAVTDVDGAYQLMTNGAHGPLHLGAGEYRFTLESAGAPFKKDYSDPQKTPLKVTWSGDETILTLQVPASDGGLIPAVRKRK